MLVTIGTRPRPEGLVGLLLECHERIRSFLTLAENIGLRTDASWEERRDACARCRRYFLEAFPLHLADEEDSLAPRLRGKAPELDAALAAMGDEHGAHAPLLTRLLDELEGASQPSWDQGGAEQLLEAATELKVELASHLAAEERLIFPQIRARLTPDEERAVLSELRARRGEGSGRA